MLATNLLTTSRCPFEIVYRLHPRGSFELKELKDRSKGSGYVEDFFLSMKEVHDLVRKTLQKSNQKITQRVDEKKKDLKFQVGDLVMVYLNKERLQKGIPNKLQVGRLRPRTILSKYGNNAYKVEHPKDIRMFHIFTIVDLVQYKGLVFDLDHNLKEVIQEVADMELPSTSTKKEKMIFNSRVYKKTRQKTYWEHLFKNQ